MSVDQLTQREHLRNARDYPTYRLRLLIPPNATATVSFRSLSWADSDFDARRQPGAFLFRAPRICLNKESSSLGGRLSSG